MYKFKFNTNILFLLQNIAIQYKSNIFTMLYTALQGLTVYFRKLYDINGENYGDIDIV